MKIIVPVYRGKGMEIRVPDGSSSETIQEHIRLIKAKGNPPITSPKRKECAYCGAPIAPSP